VPYRQPKSFLASPRIELFSTHHQLEPRQDCNSLSRLPPLTVLRHMSSKPVSGQLRGQAINPQSSVGFLEALVFLTTSRQFTQSAVLVN
jgi:hypothetical protein